MSVLLLVIPLLLMALAFADPQAALAVLAALKRRLRRRVIRRQGAADVSVLAAALHVWAREQDLADQEVEEAIASHYESIVERLGTRAANEILGEPTPLERWH